MDRPKNMHMYTYNVYILVDKEQTDKKITREK